MSAPTVWRWHRLVREGKIPVNRTALRFATFVYNLVAGVLSGLGFLLMVQDPTITAPSGWYPEPTQLPATRFVIVAFCLTKPVEFIDTFLTKALHGREPKFIAVYHHVATAIVSWCVKRTLCNVRAVVPASCSST